MLQKTCGVCCLQVKANKGITALDWAARSPADTTDCEELIREHAAQAAQLDAGAAAASALVAYQASTDQDRVDLNIIGDLLRYLYAVDAYSGGQVRSMRVLILEWP